MVASAAGGARCWDGGEQEARGLKEGSGNSVRESRGLGEMGGNSVNAPGRRRRQGNGERWSDSHRRDEERLARLAGRRGKVGRELHGRSLNGAGCVGRGRVARGLPDAVFQGVHHRECRQRRGPANVPLSCWRGFAAAPHRGAATSKAVPISFSGVLAGLWGGRWLVGGAGPGDPGSSEVDAASSSVWTAARPPCRAQPPPCGARRHRPLREARGVQYPRLSAWR